MIEQQQKFKDFYEDKNNWRPPSYTQIMAHMGWTSKNSVSNALKKYENQKKIEQEEKVSNSAR